MNFKTHPPVIDEILKSELARSGSDQRCGVNFIVRPPDHVKKLIVEIQDSLKKMEPRQYYYPPSDLHITFVEVASGLSPEEATSIFKMVSSLSATLLKDFPIPVLKSPRLRIDHRAGALVFQEIEGLNSARGLLEQALSKNGVNVVPRYVADSAHVTFLRYLSPLVGSWENLNEKAETILLQPDLSWTVDTLWLTSGATWYGMRERIKEKGPFSLTSNSHF